MGKKDKNKGKKTPRGFEPDVDNDQLGENASGEGVQGTNTPIARPGTTHKK